MAEVDGINVLLALVTLALWVPIVVACVIFDAWQHRRRRG